MGKKIEQVKGDQECQGAGCNFKLSDLGRHQWEGDIEEMLESSEHAHIWEESISIWGTICCKGSEVIAASCVLGRKKRRPAWLEQREPWDELQEIVSEK